MLVSRHAGEIHASLCSKSSNAAQSFVQQPISILLCRHTDKGQRSWAEMLLTTSSIAEQSTTDIIFFNHLLAALYLHSFNRAVQLNKKSLKKLFWLELYSFSYE